MNQYIYTLIIMGIATLLACTKAFGTEEEDTMLYLEAVRMTRYIHPDGVHIPFKVRMVDTSPIPGEYVGACILVAGKADHVQIVRKEWQRADSIDRAYMLVHELLHCLKGLDHSDDPNNILYWQMPSNRDKKKEILDKLWLEINITHTKSF
jgi:hypothetical protein